ncbi:adenylate/guanylate cyclase domain-containing protein [Pseudovibrio exalbescens]|uniref:adenylate/guanylate cyclase domain-containing protein n=1 Tax=Pseudovibrio exalbescens TaxID=197461 RepID=UPI002365AE66|nr:adenylate/guanylate cyclase domain-containing protein [Pseudovibrio exalbescens]MDD7909117.1 adenylate/guanylate cyclase domain-containing protein [Pseudovibrio exalbescens]
MRPWQLRRKLRRVSLTAIVGVGFGTLVAVCGGLVLILSVSANLKNTRDLLEQTADLSLYSIESVIKSSFDPISSSIQELRDFVEGGDIYISDEDQLAQVLSGVLLGNRNIDMAAFTDLAGRAWGIGRTKEGELIRFEGQAPSELQLQNFFSVNGLSGEPQWGRLLKADGRIFANVSVPVHYREILIGHVTAGVSMEQLSSSLSQFGVDHMLTTFVLSNRGDVIAYSGNGLFSEVEKGPLLSPIKEYGDPVLAQLPNAADFTRPKAVNELGLRVLQVTVDDVDYIILLREMQGFGYSDWIVGQYFEESTVEGEIQRLARSALAGGFILIISAILAIIVGRRVAGPLGQIADRAEHIGRLEFENIKPMDRSMILELDKVATVMNHSTQALKAMSMYVPRTLFSKLLNKGLDNATKPREAQLTILFTDIAEFTTISETHSATEVAELLNDHFAILVKAIEDEGGTVDKFLGDGLLAFWGAPDERPDHAEAAMRAARRIAKDIAEHNRANPEAALKIRIGVHSGAVIVGNVGGQDRWNYTVIGDAVNVANRLQGLGKGVAPGAHAVILASGETVEQLSHKEGLQNHGQRQIRGRDAPVEIWAYEEE